MDFNTVVNSGLSVGVPGTPALWAKALRDYGTLSLNEALKPAERLAAQGLRRRPDLRRPDGQPTPPASRSSPRRRKVFLRDGQAPAVGSTFTNPDMAKAYRTLRTQGVDVLYPAARSRRSSRESRAPHTEPGSSRHGRADDDGATSRAYRALTKAPIHSQYKGYDVYGMPVPSSGGIAVAEILNLMQAYEDRTGSRRRDLSDVDYLHRFSEASATAFADRNRWVGDVPDVPVQGADRPGLRGRAGLPLRPDEGPAASDPVRLARRHLHLLRARHDRAERALRGPVDVAPDGHRPLGQRRVVHADDRADRRLGHHGPGLRLPAQQRADRLQLHAADARGPGPEPARPGQATAVVDEPDDPARRRQAVPRGRLARRRHDHHVGVARRSSATSTATSRSSTRSRRRGSARATARARAPSRRSSTDRSVPR